MPKNLPAALAVAEAPQNTRGDTRLRFIQSTSELMVEMNSIDVTLLQIAARAKLNSALIKYHFGNKDGLLTAVALHAAEKNMEALSELVEARISPRKKMEIHLTGLMQLYWHHPYINVLCQYILRHSEQKYKDAIDQKIMQPFIELQNRIIREGIELGEFRNVDPEMTFYIMRGACDSLIDASQQMGNAYRVRGMSQPARLEYTHEVVNMLMYGISSRA
ncbi:MULTISPECIES: TetR/AcrR family transcriptional regulator C-terminal domain-containing protein [Sphingobium]|uniref:TetR/AcrR family transcriptional regulator C-terminal domain-containing protein n=1 Tax=Sphingobium TaxID=165695 RepID=UPI00159C7FAB|nr:TetR/AcrR family transcriptional regulator C-terminal domain-containing protein [Sphingobium sp. 15-1]